jgi:hypothetical protein
MRKPTGRRTAVAPPDRRVPAPDGGDAQAVIAAFLRRLERLAGPAPAPRRRAAR